MADHVVTIDKPSLGLQLAELRRERIMRRQVYPKLIAAKKLSQKTADWQIACLEGAIRTLEEIANSKRNPETT